MSVVENRRVRPGEPPVPCPAGRAVVSVRSERDDPVDVVILDSAIGRARPIGPGSWSIELQPDSTGRVGVICPGAEVFPGGSALLLTVQLPGDLQLNVHPRPDVSGLRSPALLTWSPGPSRGPDGSAHLLVQVLDVGTEEHPLEPAGAGPAGAPLTGAPLTVAPGTAFDIEPLGQVALQARNIAREIVGGPRVTTARQRSVHVVLDASTSMRTLSAGRHLADVVAVVLGTAAVVDTGSPSLYAAHGPQLQQLASPREDVGVWLRGVYDGDAFGFAVEAVRQGLPPAQASRELVVVTDDVPADLDELTDHVEPDAEEGSWRVLVLDAPAPLDLDLRASRSSARVCVVPVPTTLWDGAGGLHPARLRQLVGALLGDP